MPMKSFIRDHEVITDDDALELALGTPLELWLGYDGETDADREAREFAAADILAEQPELYDVVVSLLAEVLVAYVLALGPVTKRPRTRRTSVKGATA